LRYVVAVIVLVLMAAGIFVGVQWSQSVPAPTFKAQVSTSVVLPGIPTSLPWPSVGSAAVAVEGLGVIGSSGTTSPQAIASIAKVMTAYLILEDHPLTAGASGPNITFSAADAATYRADLAQSQSVIPVVAGESLTELQALEAMLIPSANNIAVRLAEWDSSNVSAFVTKMNAAAVRLGMRSTTFTDPSGLESTTLSTPTDLILLGEAAMANPVFASIVSMPQVTLPQAGTVYNFDYDLGREGIAGIKTGSDSAAGGCFLFESTEHADGRQLKVVGAVLGQQTASPITAALNEAKALVPAALAELHTFPAVASGLLVGYISAPWAKSVTVNTSSSLSVFGWAGQRFTLVFHFSGRLAVPIKAGEEFGKLVLEVPGHPESTTVEATGAITAPSASWRLEH
jgi:serine-type D-Ala-D-Ala carboxypeptidase (penicillin-binding protein 5/6)